MRDWIHWLRQQWEREEDLSPELTREVVRAEEALEDVFLAGVLPGGGLAAEILREKQRPSIDAAIVGTERKY